MNKVLKEYGTTLGLVWVGCFILFIFVYVLVLKPQSQLKKSLSKELEQKQRDYIAARETSQEETRNRLIFEVEELESKLRQFVADSNGAANLTFDVSRMANENRVLSFSIKARDNKGVFEIPQCSLIGENWIDVSFVSDFRGFAMFLNALERHDPVVFVDTFSISKATRDDVGNKVNMGLSVLVEKGEGG